MMLRTVLSAFALVAITACGVSAQQDPQPTPAPAAAAPAAATPTPAPAPAADPAATTPAPAADPAAAPAAATEDEEIKAFTPAGRLPRCPGDPRCPSANTGVAPRGNAPAPSGGGGADTGG